MSGLDRACHEALEVLLTRDDPATDRDALRAAQRHAERCPMCAGIVDDAEDDTAARAVLATLGRRRRPALRVLLGVVAGVQLVFGIAWVFGWNLLASSGMHAGDEHLARDGAIGVVVGVAGVVTARAPRFAVPMLMMAGAAFGLQLLGFALDEHEGRVSALFEVQHMIVAAIVLLLAVLAFRRPAPVEEPRRGPHLRVVR